MSKFHEKPNQFVKDIVLKVLDLEKSKVFYTEVMGFKVLNSDNKQVEITVDGINSIITLKQPKAVIEKLPNQTGLYHFAILLSSSVDLALFIKNLIDKQYPITGASISYLVEKRFSLFFLELIRSIPIYSLVYLAGT